MFYAKTTTRVYFDHPSIRTAVSQNQYLEARSGTAPGRDSSAREKDGFKRLTDPRLGRRSSFSELSSRAQPCGLDSATRQLDPPPSFADCLRTLWTCSVGGGRYHRATAWREDQGPRYLPRSGALLPLALCENWRPTLAGCDVTGSHSLGATSLGAAFSHCAGSL